MDAHRSDRDTGDREASRPPDQPGSRVRRGIRSSCGAECRARRLSIEGRRKDVGQDSVPRRQDGRERAGHRSERRAGDLRGAVAGVPKLVGDVERRSRQRRLQDDRRRRSLDRDHAQSRPAQRHPGQDWPVGVGRRLEPRLRADGSRRRRLLHVRRCRRDMEKGDRPARPTAAGLLLHTRVRRSEGEGHGVRAERELPQVNRCGEDLDHDPRAARRQPRYVDRAERVQSDDRSQRRRRNGFGQRRRDVDGGNDADRAVLSRHHDEARAVSRVRRPAGQQHGVRLESTAARRTGRSRRRRRSGVLFGRRRRERLHRERSTDTRCVLRGELWRSDYASGSQDRSGAPD